MSKTRKSNSNGSKRRTRSRSKSKSKTPKNMTAEQSKIWYLAKAFKKNLSPKTLKNFLRLVNRR